MRPVLKYPGSKWNNDYLSGWQKMHFNSCAEQGKPRTETVWMNYSMGQQMTIYDMQGVIG